MLAQVEQYISHGALAEYMKRPELLTYNDQPLYGLREAALYCQVREHVMRLWVEKRLIQTPFDDRNLSYNNLIEGWILRTIKAEGVKGANLEEAVRMLRKLSPDSEHPLFEVRLSTDGTRLFLREWRALVDLSKGGQYAFQTLVGRHLKRIEWGKDRLPMRFYPPLQNPRSNVVVIRPDVGSGRPTVAGEGILVSVLHGRWAAGESVEDLAYDYELKPSVVKVAIDYYEQLKAA